eukprot:g80835.t1
MKRKLVGGALGASFLKVLGEEVRPCYRSPMRTLLQTLHLLHLCPLPSLPCLPLKLCLVWPTPPPVSSTICTASLCNEPAPQSHSATSNLASVFKSDIHSFQPTATPSSSVHVPFFNPGNTITSHHDTQDIDLDLRTSTLPLYITLQIPIPRTTTSSSVTAKANLKRLKKETLKKSYQFFIVTQVVALV